LKEFQRVEFLRAGSMGEGAASTFGGEDADADRESIDKETLLLWLFDD
jgi:hypothetical protein